MMGSDKYRSSTDAFSKKRQENVGVRPFDRSIAARYCCTTPNPKSPQNQTVGTKLRQPRRVQCGRFRAMGSVSEQSVRHFQRSPVFAAQDIFHSLRLFFSYMHIQFQHRLLLYLMARVLLPSCRCPASGGRRHPPRTGKPPSPRPSPRCRKSTRGPSIPGEAVVETYAFQSPESRVEGA